MRRLWRGWRDFRRLTSLPATRRDVVVFSHGRQDWPHLWPLVKEFTESTGVPVSYICATLDDPALQIENELIQLFVIADLTAQSALWRTLQAGIVISTLPDLGTGHWARSSRVWRYVFVPHSIVSCHMIYKPAAFDGFDEVFCVGPHHHGELRALEAARSTHRKQLFAFGYPRLDEIRKRELSHTAAEDSPEILVAPSWGPSGLIETMGPELVSALLEAGCRVTVRPHPETERRSPERVREIERLFGREPRVRIDRRIEAFDSFFSSVLMVSDWSGVALEYALGLGRPVLFVDTPRKVNNPGYEALAIEPIEVRVRQDLGRIVGPLPAEIGKVARETIEEQSPETSARLRGQASGLIHNIDCSAQMGAARIRELLDELKTVRIEA